MPGLGEAPGQGRWGRRLRCNGYGPTRAGTTADSAAALGDLGSFYAGSAAGVARKTRSAWLFGRRGAGGDSAGDDSEIPGCWGGDVRRREESRTAPGRHQWRRTGPVARAGERMAGVDEGRAAAAWTRITSGEGRRAGANHPLASCGNRGDVSIRCLFSAVAASAFSPLQARICGNYDVGNLTRF